MKRFLFVLIAFIVTFTGQFSIINSEKLRFDNYRVYNVYIANEQQLNLVKHLEKSGYQIWNTPIISKIADVMVPPHLFGNFHEIVENNYLEISVKIENVQELIDNEQPKIQPRAFGWEAYYTYEEIFGWLDALAAVPENNLSMQVIGFTTEQREIRVYKLSRQEGNDGVIIESNIHAREWISSATSTWILNELLTSDDPAVIELSQNIDWYFIPILNVDGLHYTHTVNRLWRKTRSLHPPYKICYGVDLNRNFDFQFGVIGASDDPCAETYHGPVGFSDPESSAVRDFYIEVMDNIKAYIAYHSYGQYMLYPYGYTTENVENFEDLQQIGDAGAAAVYELYNTTYIVGSTANVLYFNSGSSRDWVRGAQGQQVSYTIELRDTGTYGFVLPANQIIPNALESFEGLKAMINECRVLGYIEPAPIEPTL